MASEGQQLVEFRDRSHCGLYDREEPVGLALEKIIPFFRTHPGEGAAAAEAA